jgi:aldose 1-epimerase
MVSRRAVVAACLAAATVSLAEGPATVTKPAIEKDRFGVTADGTQVDRYTLRNARGMTVRLITFGATVTELWVPDRNGDRADVVLGFDGMEPYERPRTYFGCTVGRVAFRIDEGRFTLDGRPYQLTVNAPPHHLHGGTKGLSKLVWRAEPVAGLAGSAVRFTCRSPDGDQGYPGTLDVSVVYTLTEQNELRIEYRATTDRPTPVSLTHHGYFNLAGAGRGDVLGHVLQLQAAGRPVGGERGMPTGAIEPVAGTPFDFRAPKTIAKDMQPGTKAADGFDTAFVVERPGEGLVPVARLSDPGSGRVMEVLSTQPAVVLYTANYLDGSLVGKGGVPYGKHSALCLETSHLPNSVNRPEFPSIILRPGEAYEQTCVYRFAVEEP